VVKLEKEKRLQNSNVKYTILNYILFFFAFSFIGWIWEVGLCLVQSGELVKKGTLFGPWLPIYGAGGVLVLILFRRFYKKPVLTFFLSMIVCSILEYFTSYFLEKATGLRWWDYSGFLLNLDGRICLEGSIIFGIGGCLVIYYAAPFLKKYFDKIKRLPLIIFTIILSLLFIADEVYSRFHPNVSAGINITEKNTG